MTTTKFETLLAVSFLSALWFATPTLVRGEETERIPIPVSGDYIGEATLTSSRTAGIPIFPSKSETEAFVVEVSECADQIIVHHAQLEQGVVTTFQDGSWSGEQAYQGVATIGLKLDPLSREEIRATYSFDLPMVAHTQKWIINMKTVAPADVPAGAGDIVVGNRIEGARQGLWKVEHVKYGVRIFDFLVNDSELLFRHRETLDQVADILTGRNWQPDADAICPFEPAVVSSSPVYGFASETGPERINVELADDRARKAALYLRNAVAERVEPGSREFPWLADFGPPPSGATITTEDGELLRPVPGLEGVESACNRAVMFFLTMKEVKLALYTAEDARKWLEEDLKSAKEKYCSFLNEGDPTQRMVAEQNARDARREARSMYALAMNYLDLVEQGNCDPPGQRDPSAPLGQGGWSCSEDHPACLALNYSEDPKVNLRKALEKAMEIDGATLESDFLQAMDSDPWFEATYRPHGPEVTRNADEVECQIFPDKVRQSVERGNENPNGFESWLPAYSPCPEAEDVMTWASEECPRPD